MCGLSEDGLLWTGSGTCELPLTDMAAHTRGRTPEGVRVSSVPSHAAHLLCGDAATPPALCSHCCQLSGEQRREASVEAQGKARSEESPSKFHLYPELLREGNPVLTQPNQSLETRTLVFLSPLLGQIK